jgi:RNA recognition motif-containing protein
MESTLWMGDIEPWMTQEIIMNSFFEYGIKPSSIKMIRDHKLNISKNFCFINFENMVEANNALINLNGKKIPKTEINFRLNWANKHCERNRNLYVGNLPSDLDDIQLFNIFKEKYPSIHHVSIMTDNGESKGYGFIQFINKNDYEKCLKEMDGYFIKGKPIIVKERKKKNFEEKNWNNLNNSYKYNNINIPMVINNANNNNNKKIYNKKNNYNHGINNINVRNMSNNEIINGSNNDYFYKYNNKINPLLFSKEQLNNSNNNNNFEENEDLSSSISSSSNSEKRKFSSNLDLIVNDDHNALNKKIQESVNKMFEHYKYQSKNNEEFNMIVYYGSNKFNFSDDFYFQKL